MDARYNHRAGEELNQGKIIDKKLSQARVSDKKPVGAVKNRVDEGELYTEQEKEAIEINTLMEEEREEVKTFMEEWWENYGSMVAQTHSNVRDEQLGIA